MTNIESFNSPAKTAEKLLVLWEGLLDFIYLQQELRPFLITELDDNFDQASCCAQLSYIIRGFSEMHIRVDFAHAVNYQMTHSNNSTSIGSNIDDAIDRLMAEIRELNQKAAQFYKDGTLPVNDNRTSSFTLA